ncbi:hypothetical protein [Streptomyces sp. CB03238]|uniref:hypothetical protein n=1 Tax=Streptomyces sp. CB03238 TaxID=1907777 RepID=UPI000A119847|nr:hypothetical protein [Streptomyces sp. CB03238]ORT59713.1 hypothetical protein BKD26_12525 [Streptomyces sp. CB03238]
MSKNLDASVPVVSAAVAAQPAQAEGEPLSEPTGLATVTLFLVPEGPGVSVSVPGKDSDHLLRTLVYLGATAATTIGPVALLKVASAIDLPWQAAGGLALLLALMPLAYVLLSARRSRRN